MVLTLSTPDGKSYQIPISNSSEGVSLSAFSESDTSMSGFLELPGNLFPVLEDRIKGVLEDVFSPEIAEEILKRLKDVGSGTEESTGRLVQYAKDLSSVQSEIMVAMLRGNDEAVSRLARSRDLIIAGMKLDSAEARIALLKSATDVASDVVSIVIGVGLQMAPSYVDILVQLLANKLQNKED